MLYQTNQIAQAEFKAFEAKFNNRRTPEGVTVIVPNILDRALAALRNALTGRKTAVGQPRHDEKYNPRGLPAK